MAFARLRTASLGLCAGAGLAAMTPVDARAAGLADFFDSVFGGGQAARPTEHVPLGVTVRGRSRGFAPRSRRARAERPRERRPAIVAIDPVANPNWFMDDPTLRRGDIVVLDGQVLVFEGGKPPHGPESFSSLGKTRLLSQAERERVGAMAGLRNGGREPDVVGEKTKTAGSIDRD